MGCSGVDHRESVVISGVTPVWGGIWFIFGFLVIPSETLSYQLFFLSNSSYYCALATLPYRGDSVSAVLLTWCGVH